MKTDLASVFAMVLAGCGGAVAGAQGSAFDDSDAGQSLSSSGGSSSGCTPPDETQSFDLSPDEMRSACEPAAPIPPPPDDDAGTATDAAPSVYDPVDAGCACMTVCKAQRVSGADSCRFVSPSKVL